MKEDTQKVTVENIDMPFSSIVKFLVKISLASIPAVIIVTLVVVCAVGFFSGLLGSM